MKIPLWMCKLCLLPLGCVGDVPQRWHLRGWDGEEHVMGAGPLEKRQRKGRGLRDLVTSHEKGGNPRRDFSELEKGRSAGAQLAGRCFMRRIILHKVKPTMEPVLRPPIDLLVSCFSGLLCLLLHLQLSQPDQRAAPGHCRGHCPEVLCEKLDRRMCCEGAWKLQGPSVGTAKQRVPRGEGEGNSHTRQARVIEGVGGITKLSALGAVRGPAISALSCPWGCRLSS